MTWSLEVRNGDLALGGAKLGTVTAEQKLKQDLAHWLQERMGTDPLHREYGSLIDGGVTPDGREVPTLIGSDDISFAAMRVESDIRRIVGAYQSRQLARAKADRQRYNKTTLTPGELLLSLDAVDMEQVLDVLRVTLHITTGSGVGVTLDVAVPDAVIGS